MGEVAFAYVALVAASVGSVIYGGKNVWDRHLCGRRRMLRVNNFGVKEATELIVCTRIITVVLRER